MSNETGRGDNTTPTESHSDSYNGWANRETWAVALHINNDQGWQESVHKALRDWWGKAPRGYRPDPNESRLAGEIIRDNVETLLSPDSYEFEFGERQPVELAHALYDIGSLWRVDWTVLGASFLADLGDER